MQLKKFKIQYAGQYFVIKLNDPPQLLSFDGVENLRNYAFADNKLKQLIYEKMVAGTLGHIFLRDELASLDPDELEIILYEHAGKDVLLEVIASQPHCIKIDVDSLTANDWAELNSPTEHNEYLTFDILTQLLK